MIDKDYAKSILKKRDKDIHKGDAGHLLIIAGSAGMTGAAVLCAKSAFRSGAGLVYMYVPSEIFPILQISVPEAICLRRNEEVSYDNYEAIVIGPGLGKSRETADLLSDVLSCYNGKIVIDADALNVIAMYDMYEELEKTKAEIICTPHGGEAARHLKNSSGERKEYAEKLAKLFKGIAVLKGNKTVVSNGEKTLVNTTGNPGMATAGSGDVLAGIIGALAAQGYDGLNAASCGVYIHGLAGDMAADINGQWGLMASDIANSASKAIKDIIGE